ncbi:hypothetical protein KRR55_16955 [Paeniglutamicibacter sp. ABSL32-1]|uniref:hypothetical protein n=1 Tax=Paeniglutamicibacter quisquiliarum TaxID=2849498 RepID=UPI001C2DA556|nr:hypothetical protein [Paeniglutamicibacter quisquiliarum]MBV1780805.1 hypothetical protein [Paeniglutamicibacter quisquiliarum]
MSAIKDPARRTRPGRFTGASTIWLFLAAALFLASATLRLLAAFQRRAAFSSLEPSGIALGEGPVPASFDPTASLEAAARLQAAGIWALALGVAAMAIGVLAVHGPGILRKVIEMLLALLVAVSLAFQAMNVLTPGTIASSEQMEYSLWLLRTQDLAVFAGLISLACLWGSRLRAAMTACLFLLGSTMLGELLAGFLIAAVLGASATHDMLLHSEAMIAGTVAAAGAALLFAARTTARRSGVFS